MKLTLYNDNIFNKMPKLQSESIDLVITSPPYWGLRNYDIEGQVGLEPTMEDYLDNIMLWVKEVYRVLKPSGSFILNIGDTFFTKRNKEQCEQVDNSLGYKQCRDGFPKEYGIYKSKQLLSVSSFAYCRIITETDFVCRGEHIWCKPNVPSPIRSRLKHSHEKLFWFVKDAENYYFDKEPWMKKIMESSQARNLRATLTVKDQCGVSGKHNLKQNTRTTSEQLRYMRFKAEKDSPHADNINLSDTLCFRSGKGNDYLKNQDTIEHSWRIIPVGARQTGFELTGKLPSEHIAPFPENLIAPYIQSMCPPDGVILDPFIGSGTVMRMAMEYNRNCIGIELNPKYIDIIKKRLNWGSGLNVIYEG